MCRVSLMPNSPPCSAWWTMCAPGVDAVVLPGVGVVVTVLAEAEQATNAKAATADSHNWSFFNTCSLSSEV